VKTDWDFTAVPWKPGVHFEAPTCAVCHNSLLTDGNEKVIADRTHDFGSRLWVRIFGLIVSHPQPREGATHTIRNPNGLPLPTTFDGRPATGFLIDSGVAGQRKTGMQKVCVSCHATSWTLGQFERLDQTIREADRMVLTATELLQNGWDRGLADPANPFDEELEHLWLKQWLISANSVRYASAMMGPDYATFKNGWWDLTVNTETMRRRLGLPRKAR
jgi:hypothetical protein